MVRITKIEHFAGCQQFRLNGIHPNTVMRWKVLVGLVRATASGYFGGDSFQYGAALSFYGVFALAPTLLIAIALAGIFFGEDAAKGHLDATLADALGNSMAQAFAESLTYVHVSQSGGIAALIGFIVMLFAVTALFVQLQTALNAIWGVQPKPSRGFWNAIRSQLIAFVVILIIGALLLLSLVANAAMVAAHAFLPAPFWSDEPLLWEGVDWILLVVLITLLFALIFKLLPDARIAWYNVLVGAVITALLFVLGNFLFCQYLYHLAPASVYGPASSLVAVMLWVYYSSQVLLFGAEFTKNFAEQCGKPVQPAKYAMYRPR
jgi:membrane protein